MCPGRGSRFLRKFPRNPSNSCAWGPCASLSTPQRSSPSEPMPTDSTVPPGTAAGLYEFGPFRFDVATRSLYRGTAFIALTPKAAETLLALVEEAGRGVAKGQPMRPARPGGVVEET